MPDSLDPNSVYRKIPIGKFFDTFELGLTSFGQLVMVIVTVDVKCLRNDAIFFCTKARIFKSIKQL